MAGKDIKYYRKKLLKFLVSLRDVGMETKFHIYDVLLDPHRTRKRKSQFIAVAIVSKNEIFSENCSVLKDFTDNLHKINDPSMVLSRVIHHGRVAVAMNAGEKHFFEHGECRIFDPYRECLLKLIDDQTEKKKQNKRGKFDRGGHGVLENMENDYIKSFHNLFDAVFLLFSFYIPCSIDFHDCARLLHMFVKDSGHEMAVGYEQVHDLTDQSVSLKWLTMRNITVISGDEIEREIHRQFSSLTGAGDDNSHEDECIYDENEDIFCDNSESDDVEELKAAKHLRQFGKGHCRKILNKYNKFC